MIRHYLSNNNEYATVPKSKLFRELNTGYSTKLVLSTSRKWKQEKKKVDSTSCLPDEYT